MKMTMAAPEFIGEHRAPAPRRENRVMCLYRDAECVVTYLE